MIQDTTKRDEGGARYSVSTWDGDALQAAFMRVGRCQHGDTIGFDLCAQDETCFAHGHLELAQAIQLRESLDIAIAELAGAPS